MAYGPTAPGHSARRRAKRTSATRSAVVSSAQSGRAGQSGLSRARRQRGPSRMRAVQQRRASQVRHRPDVRSALSGGSHHRSSGQRLARSGKSRAARRRSPWRRGRKPAPVGRSQTVRLPVRRRMSHAALPRSQASDPAFRACRRRRAGSHLRRRRHRLRLGVLEVLLRRNREVFAKVAPMGVRAGLIRRSRVVLEASGWDPDASSARSALGRSVWTRSNAAASSASKKAGAA